MKKLTRLLLIAFCLSIIAPVQTVSAQPDVSAESAVMVTADTGNIIYSKNSSQQMPMASTTKIMTALIALEQDDLDTYFVVDDDAIQVEGSSMGLQIGDQVSLRALVYGMLLLSGNDAANAAAVYISGSLESFAELMNQKAQEIGMENTNFVTPSGLDDEKHYSTTEDMAKLARVALKNSAFKEICSTYSTKVSYGNPPYDRWMTNHNRLLNEYEGTVGLKTGFTKKSGRCLVSAAERDGKCFIIVTLNAPSDWQDHKDLFDYAFTEIELTKLPDVDCNVKVTGGTSQSVKVLMSSEAQAVLTADELNKIQQRISLLQFYYAPIAEGQVLGYVDYIYNDEVICTVTLVADRNIELTEIEIKEETPSLWEQLKLSVASIIDKILSWLTS